MSVGFDFKSLSSYFTDRYHKFNNTGVSLSDKHKSRAKSLLEHLPEINKDDYTTLPLAVKVYLLTEAKDDEIGKFLDLDVASILIGEKVKDTLKSACFEKLCVFEEGNGKLIVQGVDLKSAESVERLVAAIPKDISDKTRELDISSCYAITNLGSVLSRFENLEKLNISNLKLLKSLEGIEKAANTLKELNASGIGGLKSVSDLEKCTNLVSLNLSGARLLDDLRPLKLLDRLEELVLNDCYSTNFFGDFLPRLKHLKTLSMQKNRNFKDPSLLTDCDKLEKVDISKTGVTSIEALLKLPNLKKENIKTEGCKLSS